MSIVSRHWSWKWLGGRIAVGRVSGAAAALGAMEGVDYSPPALHLRARLGS